MCKCESCLDFCLCYTCKNKSTRIECNDCDICYFGDMCVFACNQYEEEREDKE